jgi:hypothetical protein
MTFTKGIVESEDSAGQSIYTFLPRRILDKYAIELRNIMTSEIDKKYDDTTIELNGLKTQESTSLLELVEKSRF